MNKETNYWKTAEQMNGRLAMMGFFAAVINYGITAVSYTHLTLPTKA